MSGRIIKRGAAPVHVCEGKPLQGDPGDEWACDDCGAVWLAKDSPYNYATRGQRTVRGVDWVQTTRRVVER